MAEHKVASSCSFHMEGVVPSTSWKWMRNCRYLLRMGWEEWSSLLGLFCFCVTQDWRGCWEGNTTLQPIYFAPTYGGWTLSLWVKILSGNKESLEEMHPPGVQSTWHRAVCVVILCWVVSHSEVSFSLQQSFLHHSFVLQGNWSWGEEEACCVIFQVKGLFA